MLQQQLFRKSRILSSEKEVDVIGIGHIAVCISSFCGEKIKSAVVSGEKVIQPGIIGNVQIAPVVQSRPFELFIVHRKAHRLDEMKPRAGGGAGAGDISRILGDLGFDQNDVERCQSGASLFLKDFLRLY